MRRRVAEVAQLGLGRCPAGVDTDDLGAELLGAEARIGVGLLAAQAVVDVQRRDAVAELAQREQEAASSRRRPRRGTAPLPPGAIRSWRRMCCLDALEELHAGSVALTSAVFAAHQLGAASQSSSVTAAPAQAPQRVKGYGRRVVDERHARRRRRAGAGAAGRTRSAASGRRRGSTPPAGRAASRKARA